MNRHRMVILFQKPSVSSNLTVVSNCLVSSVDQSNGLLNRGSLVRIQYEAPFLLVRKDSL